LPVAGEFAIQLAAGCDRSYVFREFDATGCGAVDAYFDSLSPEPSITVDAYRIAV